MVFSSPIFLFIFLPLVLFFYWLTPKRFKNALLLIASLIFFAWGGLTFLPMLIIMIGLNWLGGMLIEHFGVRTQDKKSLMALKIFVAVDILVLCYFKYLNFLWFNLTELGGWFGHPPPPISEIILPIGISFFTFHLISYLVDIYRGIAEAQKNILDFALYICFFPQLIAGPIIRYHDVSDQLHSRRIDTRKFAYGVERFILGLAKKMIIANPFGESADHIFLLAPSQLRTPTAWFGLFCYAIQLYYDFSGYSDMAIGLGRMFGFEFLENFNYPFISQSISEFWRRWHISLSNWFRDYFYSPMVFASARAKMKKGIKGPVNDKVQLAIVFTICGIWHGANWTFVVWGFIHGFFLMLERGKFGNILKNLPRAIRHAYVLGVIFLAWVFFRAETVSQAFDFLKAMVGFASNSNDAVAARFFFEPEVAWLMPFALIGLTPAFSWLSSDWRLRAQQSFARVAAKPLEPETTTENSFLVMGRLGLLIIIFGLSIVAVTGSSYNPFIYFKF